MSVISPRPGMTLSYALVRDRSSVVRWFFQVALPGSAPGTYSLWCYRDDPSIAPPVQQELLLKNIRRLTFTSRSEGALQINLLLAEGDQDYSLLTTVQMRNLPSSEELW
jgi:hypothetical protein